MEKGDTHRLLTTTRMAPLFQNPCICTGRAEQPGSRQAGVLTSAPQSCRSLLSGSCSG